MRPTTPRRISFVSEGRATMQSISTAGSPHVGTSADIGWDSGVAPGPVANASPLSELLCHQIPWGPGRRPLPDHAPSSTAEGHHRQPAHHTARCHGGAERRSGDRRSWGGSPPATAAQDGESQSRRASGGDEITIWEPRPRVGAAGRARGMVELPRRARQYHRRTVAPISAASAPSRSEHRWHRTSSSGSSSPRPPGLTTS